MLSGNSSYTVNRDEVIAHAYRILGALRAGGVPSPADVSDANVALNMMVKAWQAHGLQLWVIKQVSIVPVQGLLTYSLGSQVNDADATPDLFKTTVRSAVLTNDTLVEVVATADMVVGDKIRITLDEGTHWTTIASIPDSDSVVLSVGVPSGASVGNGVYSYTTGIVRPHELLELYRRDFDNKVDVPMLRLSRTDFFTLSDKDTQGIPVNFYYDPQLVSSRLSVWPTAGDIFTANSIFIANIKKPFDNLDSATDDFEFPQEWYEAIAYGLAERLAPMIGYPIPDRQLLKAEAREYLDLALTFDHEQTDVSFVVDTSQDRNLFGS